MTIPHISPFPLFGAPLAIPTVPPVGVVPLLQTSSRGSERVSGLPEVAQRGRDPSPGSPVPVRLLLHTVYEAYEAT